MLVGNNIVFNPSLMSCSNKNEISSLGVHDVSVSLSGALNWTSINNLKGKNLILRGRLKGRRSSDTSIAAHKHSMSQNSIKEENYE